MHICLEMHQYVQARFGVQLLQNPPLCRSTVETQVVMAEEIAHRLGFNIIYLSPRWKHSIVFAFPEFRYLLVDLIKLMLTGIWIIFNPFLPSQVFYDLSSFNILY
jgi:hypothetical protein